jgi:hypothetical protein
MAGVAGIEYSALIRNICELALARRGEAAPTHDGWVLAQQLSGVENPGSSDLDLFAVQQ